MKIRTCPDFQFLFVKKKIRTCPDFYLSIEYLKSGLVQISYLDVSRFEIFDTKFWIRTSPNFNFGHVRIFFFSIENLKSGLVQISILDFRFYPRPNEVVLQLKPHTTEFVPAAGAAISFTVGSGQSRYVIVLKWDNFVDGILIAGQFRKDKVLFIWTNSLGHLAYVLI